MKRISAGFLPACAVLLTALLLTACDSDDGLMSPPEEDPPPIDNGPPPPPDDDPPDNGPPDDDNGPPQPDDDPPDDDNGSLPPDDDPPELVLNRLELDFTFAQPIGIAHAGDGSGQLFVVERNGIVQVIENDEVSSTPFLNLTAVVLSTGGGERGLLGIVFPPGYSGDDGHLYVHYTTVAGDGFTAGDSIVSRIPVVDGITNPSAEEILLHVPQPNANHNGGQLAFGPDGYLYIALGDGGGGGDPGGHGQNLGTLLGTLLRIDVESGIDDPYGIPPDNPFVGDDNARDEIWAWGLRNPWRFSFDRETGDLYIGDVGQGRYEEINFQPADNPGGENYGWNIMEGFHCYPPATTNCDQSGLTLPVTEYPISGAADCAVTGGFVYRGAQHPALQGVYLYGDYCSGRIRGFRLDANGDVQDPVIYESGLTISTFGEDEAGNLYLADYSSGNLYRIDLE